MDIKFVGIKFEEEFFLGRLLTEVNPGIFQ